MVRVVLLAVIALTICCACVAALLVLFGDWDRFAGRTLYARVLVHPVKVTSNFEIDANQISDELVRRMQRRAETDAALRIMLRADVNKLLRERAIPRLLNAGVLRRMIAETEGLGAVIAFAQYGSWADITVRNSGVMPLEDVAMTIPHAARVEATDDKVLDIQTSVGGLAAVRLGDIAADAEIELSVWFDQGAAEISARATEFRLGADGGVRGWVNFYDPDRAWNGADLEIKPWARWLTAGVLAFVASAAFACVVLIIIGLFRSRLINRV